MTAIQMNQAAKHEQIRRRGRSGGSRPWEESHSGADGGWVPVDVPGRAGGCSDLSHGQHCPNTYQSIQVLISIWHTAF